MRESDDLTPRVPTLLAKFTAFVVAICLAACVPTPPVKMNRERCYTAAEARATSRAIGECPGKWSTCEARPAILSELSASEKACP
jgi:hypothetical protein